MAGKLQIVHGGGFYWEGSEGDVTKEIEMGLER